MEPNDPVNRYHPEGTEIVQNPYGGARQVADASGKLSEQLQSLEGEKISLMKRLNMVLAELEKATHEKSDVALKLREQERHAEELRQKLGEVQSLKSVVNKNLQGDLNYERDLNTKLRDELTHFE
jgi:chromosome segregation ATPase